MLERQWLQFIANIAYDRDGYYSAKDLGELVDELREMALDGLKGKPCFFNKENPDDESMVLPKDTSYELSNLIIKVAHLQDELSQMEHRNYFWQRQSRKDTYKYNRMAKWRDIVLKQRDVYKEMSKSVFFLEAVNKKLVSERDSIILGKRKSPTGIDIKSFITGSSFAVIVLFVGYLVSLIFT